MKEGTTGGGAWVTVVRFAGFRETILLTATAVGGGSGSDIARTGEMMPPALVLGPDVM
jgi:hypothetical protein